MGVAELHGKISATATNLSERMEDLLTSDTFGCMRYVPADRALVPFLRVAQSLDGELLAISDDVVRVRYSFWPWLTSPQAIPCEPDVVLGIEMPENQVHVVLIEVKYLSGLSSEEDNREEPNDQLARELDNLDAIVPSDLGWSHQLKVVRRSLVFVTQDMGIPRELIAQSLSEYQRKRNRETDVYWLSWRSLPAILESSLENEINEERRVVLEDMLKLLVRKELTVFLGVEPVNGSFTTPDFYRSISASYTWPEVPESFNISYEYEVV